ncbi:unnamed protein product, partial [Meganyctiphanes norvegica]
MNRIGIHLIVSFCSVMTGLAIMRVVLCSFRHTGTIVDRYVAESSTMQRYQVPSVDRLIEWSDAHVHIGYIVVLSSQNISYYIWQMSIVTLMIFLSPPGTIRKNIALPILKIFPHFLVTTYIGLTTPISASSKIMTLLTILRVKDSSALSIGSYSISLYTCLTRLLTIYVESADPVLLMNFGTSTLLNTLIILAAIAYKPKEKSEEKKE